MKLRQAKKIMHSRHWDRRCRELRPMYYNEKTGHWVLPSCHDIPIPTFQNARQRYFGAMVKYYYRHGKRYGERKKREARHIP